LPSNLTHHRVPRWSPLSKGEGKKNILASLSPLLWRGGTTAQQWWVRSLAITRQFFPHAMSRSFLPCAHPHRSPTHAPNACANNLPPPKKNSGADFAIVHSAVTNSIVKFQSVLILLILSIMNSALSSKSMGQLTPKTNLSQKMNAELRIYVASVSKYVASETTMYSAALGKLSTAFRSSLLNIQNLHHQSGAGSLQKQSNLTHHRVPRWSPLSKEEGKKNILASLSPLLWRGGTTAQQWWVRSFQESNN
jgi:hypothetical protein